jgi:hypothetical protein
MLIQDLTDYQVRATAQWQDADQIRLCFQRVSTVQPYADIEFYFTVPELQLLISVLSEVLEG